MTKKNVIIYTLPTCSHCKAAKAFLKKHKVAFIEKNVLEDEDAREEMIDISSQSGVPVLKIGEDLVIGFNQERIEELLDL